MSADLCTLSSGQRIGKFVVDRLLGKGGSGEVYCVRDPELAQPIALKLLPRATIALRPDFVPLFEREYHRLQLLRHPRIVEVYQYASDRHGLFYTMELIDGPDLRASRPLPWRQTCFLLRDIALSLAIVHSRRLVHRDVGPGNVRLSRDGRAKLLDFGATVSMGIPCDVVGTPPCTPPEAFAYEPLDARADLFGLGALGYYLLTGEHAYPASTTSQLLSHWEAPLAAPSTSDREIPRALDQLISALLQRDRRLRPRSATEVINRLEAIADLTPVPAHEAAQTSFVTPALAGRSAELHLLCCHVAAARSGRGSTLLLEGAPGQGRTRLLHQLLIEASHPDVLMVEVSPEARAPERYDACLKLCEALLRQAPELVRQTLGEPARMLAEQASELRRNPRAVAVQHPELLPVLRDALLELTRRTTLVILLDDLQECDDASVALFASLAERASGKRLLIVATKQIGARVHAAHSMQSLARHAVRLLVKPLPARAVEMLVRSAFVDAQQVKFVSEWVARLSDGNPSKIVELLRYLVEHNLVAFRDGAWELPEHIDPALLPRDVADALRARVASLTNSARDLVHLLSVLVRPASLDYLRLLVDGDPGAESLGGAALGALDELSSADLITVAHDATVSVRPNVREIVLQGADAAKLQSAHTRVGNALARRFSGENYDASVDLPTAYLWAVSAYHLLRAGERRRGVQLWLNALRYSYEVDNVPIWDGNSWYNEANLLALAAAEEVGLSRGEIARLCISAVQSSLEPDSDVLAAGEAMLQELERASGLVDYAASSASADPATRITAAMQVAAERWSSTADAARSVEPAHACALLSGMALGLSFNYYHTLNAAKAAALPGKLSPFVPIVPSFQGFALLIEGIAAYVAGRTQEELEQRRDALVALESPAMRARLTETIRHHMRGLWLYAIAAIEIVRDPEAGLRRIVQMETETPFMTFGAWQLRLLAHVHQCDAVDAEACLQRMETASVQDATVARQVLHASGLQPLAAAYALAGDILGLKSLIEKLQPFAESVPSWRPFRDAARAHYHLLRGQLKLARDLAEQATAATTAGEHRGYGFATLALLRVQLEQQDNAAAHATAREALELTRAHALGPELEALLCAFGALALARLGAPAAARELGRRALSVADEAGFAGLLFGEIHRVLARVAVLERDVGLFEQHAAAVASHTCAHEHPVLLARYERLLSEATAAGLTFSVERAGAATLDHHTDLRAQLLAELARSSLARSLPERVLDLMIERAGVSTGFLFELESESLRVSAPNDADVPAGLVDALHACLAAEHAVAARGAQDTLTATRTSIVRLDDGQLFQVAVLHVRQDDGVMRAAGAIALSVRDALPAIPRWDCVLALSTVLSEAPSGSSV